jgi:electron transfer flavoprotein beta subunit
VYKVEDSMNIAVCIKRIPKTAEADIFIEKDGKDLKKDNLVFHLNDWDSYAVREAVLLKEKHGGTVTVLSIGPEESIEVLTRCLAMGADRGAFCSGRPSDCKNPCSVSQASIF